MIETLRARLDRGVGRVAGPRGAVAFWLFYAVFFVALYLALSRTLSFDDAVSAELMQGRLAAAYQVRNPPLYEWLLFLVTAILGDGAPAHAVLRYGLIALFGCATYLGALRTSGSAVVAWGVSISLVAFSWLLFDLHHATTHSLPILSLGVFAFVLVCDQIERPTVWRAALLGLVIGFGLVAKWSFALYVAGLVLALASDRDGRRLLFDVRTLATIAFAVLPLLPVIVWLAGPGRDFIDMAQHNLARSNAPWAERVAEGLVRLAIGASTFVLSWLMFMAVVGLPARRPTPDRPAPRAAIAARLALRTTVGALILAAVGVVVIGATHTDYRYMYPLFLVAPPAMAGFLAPRVDHRRFAQGVLAIAPFVFLGAAIARTYLLLDPADFMRRFAYEELVDELRVRGLVPATVIALDRRDAGNLLGLLPESQVRAAGRAGPAGTAEQPCLVVAGSDRGASPRPPEAIAADLRRLLGEAATPEAIETIAIDQDPVWGPPRRVHWHLVSGAAAASACRAEEREVGDEDG
ncbi:glycosyltransferase family 39 protein [Prosthecomicrobium pneumaticum]|uniref:Glycosyltransferase RgtA/B/C/D-like domain-containing protein n=1 Tax=Prosthecomicrobium pneumaticum TaxID=81895 RepID=A0A7W9CSI0_9HYPH|nr:glycosyltransferase family 39 protein [Prosthecomicrobium pneumaticum]MBB5751085.1 hypothetical protein [Prosthecomicrobium pneumaticum]